MTIKFKTVLKNILVSSLMLFSLGLALPNHAYMQDASYDCGTYSSGAYNEDNCPDEEGPTGGGSSDDQSGGGSGDLSGTGENAKYYGIIGIACIVLSVGLFVAQRKKKSSR